MYKSWRRQDLDGGRTDYDRYVLSGKELLICTLKALLVTGGFSYLFYRSWLGFLAFPAVWAVIRRREIKGRTALRKQRLSVQFKDAILMVTAGIQSGSSVENAFLEAEQEIRSLYGADSEMGQELAMVRKGLTNRIPLEKMLLDLGRRSSVEEIRDFTEVFAAAKRLGGNMREIIKRTANLTGQRMEVEREITTLLASRKYEQRVMMLIPFLLYGYMEISSDGFFDILYHNPAGIAVMTFCLALYLGSCVLAEKIMDIRV